MKSVYFYNFNIVKIGIAEEDGAITRVFFSSGQDGHQIDNQNMPRSKQNIAGYERAASALIVQTAEQLAEYFEGKRTAFDIPLSLHGTEFQKKVWNALQTIPFGQTRSYKDIATLTGNYKASRAVGLANNRNPIAIIVPCHRVIGCDGSLTGYAGGLSIKKHLLELEQAACTHSSF